MKKFKTIDDMLNSGYNECDKCGEIDISTDLVWFSEDFVPLKGEVVPQDVYDKYADGALCIECYKSILVN